VVEPDAPPDLLVLHWSPFVKPAATAKPAPISAWGPTRQRLARVSGRTGRVVWDIPLEEQPSSPMPGAAQPGPPTLDDLDGDGTLDAAVVIRRPAQIGQADFELKVVSLHDGVNRWSRLIRYEGSHFGYPAIVIGKGAPKVPATLFVEESRGTNTSNELLVHALDGRDGSERWTWRSGVGEGDRAVYGGIDGIALDHAEKDAVCVTYSDRRRG
jgi:outer membrane protein assembly factor BamB